MREKNIDWTSKRIERLNIILSTVLWFLVAMVMVWEIMFKGTLELAGSGNIGIIFGVWYAVQLFYANTRDQQRFSDCLETDGLLKKEP